MLRNKHPRIVAPVALSALLALATSCVSVVGDRCDEPDLPPCPNGTACIDRRCRPVGDIDAGGMAGAAGGGSSGGTAGGSSGGSAGGSSGGAGPLCPTACSYWEYCFSGSCVARYSSLTLVTPARTRSDFTASAHLNLSGGALPNPPSALRLELRDADGGLSEVSMRLIDDGGFLSDPISAARETRYEMTARWLDAGLSAVATTVIDLTAPTFVVSWPAAPFVSSISMVVSTSATQPMLTRESRRGDGTRPYQSRSLRKPMTSTPQRFVFRFPHSRCHWATQESAPRTAGSVALRVSNSGDQPGEPIAAACLSRFQPPTQRGTWPPWMAVK